MRRAVHLRNFLIAFRPIALNIAAVRTWHGQAGWKGLERVEEKVEQVEKESLAVRQGRRPAGGVCGRSRSCAEARRNHASFLTNGERFRKAVGRNLLAQVARLLDFRIAVLPERLRVSACDLAGCPGIVSSRSVHRMRSCCRVGRRRRRLKPQTIETPRMTEELSTDRPASKPVDNAAVSAGFTESPPE